MPILRCTYSIYVGTPLQEPFIRRFSKLQLPRFVSNYLSVYTVLHMLGSGLIFILSICPYLSVVCQQIHKQKLNGIVTMARKKNWKLQKALNKLFTDTMIRKHGKNLADNTRYPLISSSF